MLTRGFCGFARVSSNYTVWWSVAGKICTQIHTLVASYGGNQTDDRHYQFALPQTFCRGEKICDFFGYFTHYLALSRAFFVALFRYTHYKSTGIMYVSEYILRFCSFSAIPLECIYIQFLSFARCRCRDSVDERKVKKGVKIVCFYLNCFNLFF